jgi:hypothetical protein
MSEEQSCTHVRSHLVGALQADLVGPFDPELREELLRLPPSRFYLTGFLAPEDAREEADPTAEDELAAGDDDFEEETAGQEPEPKQRRRFPASMGLTVLVPEGATAVDATVSYADYLPETIKADGAGHGRLHWRRMERETKTVRVELTAKVVGKGVEVPGSGGVWVRGTLQPATGRDLPEGTRALSLFVVNQRVADADAAGLPRDDKFIFQVGMRVQCEAGFVARPNRRGASSNDIDERVADLQFRERVEYAVGHGVSVCQPVVEDGRVVEVATAWLPTYEVKRVTTHNEPDVETSMDALAGLGDGERLRTALASLPERYGAWISKQSATDPGDDDRRETQSILTHKAEEARRRISSGIDRLASDPQVREAFCFANRAMAMAARQRNPERYQDGAVPSWRLFQLAFVLLNIDGVADDGHADRETAELIFFPTGGGKTEAYLGVIAFALVLRRLRGQSRPDQGLGVAVLLRYTLRLLTLDQLGRAATLICALELLRREMPDKLGAVRFAVGLWVGRTATANTMEQARKLVTDYKNSKSQTARSPLPITECPWCRTELNRDSLSLQPSTAPKEVVVSCNNWREPCPFNTRQQREGIPVLFVDEQVYRELPCFIVGTVDKFAMLPWRGETGMLFGRVDGFDGRSCFGPLDRAPKSATKLPSGFRPPELIVQDELHLISGPLGTMVGLYETAIEFLSRRDGDTKTLPKIIASTATVRRASQQVQALFDRPRLAMFPPAGVDDSETFFAKVDHDSPGRLYIGIAGSGRAMKAILLRAYVSMLSAANRHFEAGGAADQAADPYMTVVGYFNSLRELGGMRRLVEDEVRTRVAKCEARRPTDWEDAHPWYRRRDLRAEPVELTSRESTANVSKTKARLGLQAVKDGAVDVLLASNMISVGVDIDRLGLMIIAGQPKTTAEYIQASSRVGRDAKRPGLVLTCFNVHKPRDRSHYERYSAFHQSFYRSVEATSVTPFSGPALDRGLAGVLVAMTRLAHPMLTPPKAASAIGEHRTVADAVIEALARRAEQHGGSDALADAVRDRARNLIEAWQTLMKRAQEDAGAPDRTYSKFDLEKGSRPLLYTWGDREDYVGDPEGVKFRAPTSMRDVEESVHLWLERRYLGGRGGGHA